MSEKYKCILYHIIFHVYISVAILICVFDSIVFA